MSPIEASSDGIDKERGDVRKREERFHPPTNCPRSEAKGEWEAKARDNKGENNQEIKSKNNREDQFQNKNFKKKHMIRGVVKNFSGQFWDYDERTEWFGKKVEDAMSDKHREKGGDQVRLTETEARLTKKEARLTEKEAREWRTRWREVAAMSKKSHSAFLHHFSSFQYRIYFRKVTTV